MRRLLPWPSASCFSVWPLLRRPSPSIRFSISPNPTTSSPRRSGRRSPGRSTSAAVRNIYVADAPDFTPRRLTPYTEDDGQELTNLSFSSDGRTIVYVRGGDHGSNRPADAPNPAGLTVQPKVQVWSVATAGSAPQLLGEGDDPAIAPDGARVAFVRDRRIWIAPIDGSKPPEAAFFARGSSESPVWSPDGRTLAFVSNRGDHSFIALFTPGPAADPVSRAVHVARFGAGLVSSMDAGSRSCVSPAPAAPRDRRSSRSERSGPSSSPSPIFIRTRP